MKTIITSETKTVTIDTDGPFTIIGEKINPTGRKKLAAQLKEGNFDLFTMNRDGSGVTKQVDNLSDAYIHNPIWSKDGRSIYFFLSGGRKDIYEMWAVDLIEYCD